MKSPPTRAGFGFICPACTQSTQVARLDHAQQCNTSIRVDLAACVDAWPSIRLWRLRYRSCVVHRCADSLGLAHMLGKRCEAECLRAIERAKVSMIPFAYGHHRATN